MSSVTEVFRSRDKLGEVPVWDVAEQALYWVDIESKRLRRFDHATGQVREWHFPERIGSFALRERGGLVCAFESGLAFFDPATEKIDWIARPEAHIPTNRFNDGKCDRKGRFWAGTMDDNLKDHSASLYRLDPDLQVTRLVGGICISNSLVWSLDNSIFYFADTPENAIYAYDYDHNAGTIANRRLFASTAEQPGTPDGSTIDEHGYLWNAQWGGWRLVRYAPDGSIDRIVELPVQRPSSCMFGGPDLATLYVTTAIWDSNEADLRAQPLAGSLLALDVGVRGVPEPRFAG
ncbi:MULTISPECIES: SMP-30/gluconolactonase/LRE family protein [unclassified Mesorhizobium]|uniref:SMP-30/gluconolactonase/LRE family protein n=1 Tax=unclassified Mesorhizobium TaxID=325217 RepID=UPI001CCBBE0E|nr:MULTISPECIES: SMP-30/gluconolactonase/LRE family protein [unclassified Mesorhizobium]MBZ9845945.1 SMP-30/gluconolactonase/LRE family protein [Mesorhizobium sp. CA5]MBZ9861975.1 SMP-30/gluconolactonase/LRE family protein [Mesorhizobium sp. CA12]